MLEKPGNPPGFFVALTDFEMNTLGECSGIVPNRFKALERL